MKEFNELDELFKEGLQNAQMTPPPGVWESVASSAASATAATSVGSSLWIVAAKWIAGGLAATAVSWLAYKSLQPSPDKEVKLKSATEQSVQSANASGSSENEEKETTQKGISNQHSQLSAIESAEKRADNSTKSELNQPEITPQIDPAAESKNPSPVQIPAHPVKPVPAADPGSVKPNNVTQTEVPCPHMMTIQVVKISDNTYNLYALNAGGDVMWDFGDGNGWSATGENTTFIATSGEFKIKAQSVAGNGCKDLANTLLSIEPGQPEFWCCITPNGDNLNDIYIPTFPAPPAYFDMTIYDQNNRQVFHTDNAAQGWNGTSAGVQSPAGRYRVVAVYKLTANSKPKTVNKPIELIR